MRLFNCKNCESLVFFENTKCIQCGSSLAFSPENLDFFCVDKSSLSKYRYCVNHGNYDACNFSIDFSDNNIYCVSCRQTRWLPDLSDKNNIRRWKVIENSKRRLFYSLAKIDLSSLQGVRAPEFEFLADLPGQSPVITGHRSGTIILNVSEADDEEITRRKIYLGEPYRTISGHLRHESGHFFWEILISSNDNFLKKFREIFGDERIDYKDSLNKYYEFNNPYRSNWRDSFISEYATSHPWEDWAETWAHYLHLMDLTETASSYNLSIAIPKNNRIYNIPNPYQMDIEFDQLLENYIPITLLANSLNRSLGQQDAYPFSISHGAIEKLKFVHEIIMQHRKNRLSIST